MQFERSQALNNIPRSKIHGAIKSQVDKCEVCSKKNINLQEAADGLCERCATISLIYQRWGESNIPLEYWKLKMAKDFQGDKRLLDKYNELVKDFSWVHKGTSIYLSGNHGTGKSFFCTAILKAALSKGYTALYTNFNDIITTLTQAPSEERFLASKELRMVELLVIDEVDSRFISSENMADLYARQLEYIVRQRRSNQLPTFMATNSPNIMEAFSGPLKQSIQSIISGYMENFVVLGSDYRKKNL